jgi:hypothetical protein
VTNFAAHPERLDRGARCLPQPVSRGRSKMFAYVAILASLVTMSVVSFAAAVMAG